MRKSVFFIIAVITTLSACHFSVKAHHSDAEQRKANIHNRKSTTSLAGVYLGMLPCADCSGIKTEIRLNKDSTYETAAEYLGKNVGVFLSRGHFEWDKNGNKIILEKGDGFNIAPRQLLFKEDSLIGLNSEGKKFQGPLPPNTFIFRKIAFNDSITGKCWRLIELQGKKVIFYKYLKRIPHFTLNPNNKMNGTDGCNTFIGNYKILPDNKIQFSNFISTKMACPDAPYQKEFMKMMEQTDSYSLEGDTLSLNNARKGLLMQFVVIYIE